MKKNNLSNKNNYEETLNKHIKFIYKNKKIKDLFSFLDYLVPESIGWKEFKYSLKKQENPNFKLAWKVLVLLSNSVLLNKIPEYEGNFGTVLNGIYSVFNEIKKYSLEYERSKITFILSLCLLNKEIRPFLGKWHSKQINENLNNLTEECKKELFELQNKIKENYLDHFSYLAKFGNKAPFIKIFTNDY